MRVIVCGDREWVNRRLIGIELSKFNPARTTIISGGCRGADTIAVEMAVLKQFRKVSVYPAQWDLYDKRAGIFRNHRMLTSGRINLVLAFHNNLQQSRGTAHMVTIASASKVEVKVITEV